MHLFLQSTAAKCALIVFVAFSAAAVDPARAMKPEERERRVKEILVSTEELKNVILNQHPDATPRERQELLEQSLFQGKLVEERKLLADVFKEFNEQNKIAAVPAIGQTVIRAYASRPTALQVMMPQAKCSMAM
jgi:hypothetical protein